MVDDLTPQIKKNLKDVLPFLKDDIFQEDTDRNRTSAFAYTGKKFEFRSLGSSQNAAFPMSVICATLAKEMEWVENKLIGGRSVEEIISELREETRAVRFDGNGYSQEWGAEAKKRGLYVNESFAELLSRVDAEAAVFEEIGACSKAEVTACCQVMRENYELTVTTEANTLLNLANQKIIPRAIKYLQVLKDNSLGSSKKGLGSYKENFSETLDRVLSGLEELRVEKGKSSDYKSACELRKKITAVGEELSELCALL
jgi:glutamine synthetase